LSRDRAAAEAALRAYSPRLFKLFTRYLDRYFARSFTAVRILKPGLPALPSGQPLIFFSNHVGWWDPIFILLICARLLPEHRHFGPIDEAALRKYGFLRRVGLFPVSQETARGAAQFLMTARRLLAEPAVALWLTPQGAFADARARPVTFTPGLAHLASHASQPVLVPVAIEYPFWSERQPEALMSFGQPIAAREQGGLGRAEWTDHLEQALQSEMDRLAMAAIARDAAQFDALVVGHARVSPVYDAWRWAKARMKGERFSARHKD